MEKLQVEIMAGREVATKNGKQFVQQCVFKTDTAYNVFDMWNDELQKPGMYDATIEIGAYNNRLTARITELKQIK